MSLLTRANSHEMRVSAAEQAAATYAVFTDSTAIYPVGLRELEGHVDAGQLYAAIGLANEVGELAELFDQEAVRTDDRIERYASAWKELGDVQWYAARLCREFPVLPSFDALVLSAYASLKSDVLRDVRLSGYDLQSGLCAQAGRLLGVVKKMMRDGGTWSPEKREEKLGELREALFCVIRLSVDFAERTGPLVGCEGGYVGLLRVNSDKLQGRKDHGTLRGDGENR